MKVIPSVLQAAVEHYKLAQANIVWVKDDPEELSLYIKNAILESDFVLISGGISAGDYDFVAETLTKNDVNCIFHKVKQKPGKPLYFGKHPDGKIRLWITRKSGGSNGIVPHLCNSCS